MDYGTGAIFRLSCPRPKDLDFAKKYNLQITEVVSDNRINLKTLVFYQKHLLIMEH